ncbi:hypothetical protein KC367_g198 [Hortaea werneckii]|nr:hypothetical protein KC367_g198 [Hortaea werneckii]
MHLDFRISHLLTKSAGVGSGETRGRWTALFYHTLFVSSIVRWSTLSTLYRIRFQSCGFDEAKMSISKKRKKGKKRDPSCRESICHVFPRVACEDTAMR